MIKFFSDKKKRHFQATDWLSSLLPTLHSPTQLNGTHVDSFRDSSADLSFSTCPSSIQNTRLIVLQRLSNKVRQKICIWHSITESEIRLKLGTPVSTINYPNMVWLLYQVMLTCPHPRMIKLQWQRCSRDPIHDLIRSPVRDPTEIWSENNHRPLFFSQKLKRPLCTVFCWQKQGLHKRGAFCIFEKDGFSLTYLSWDSYVHFSFPSLKIICNYCIKLWF